MSAESASLRKTCLGFPASCIGWASGLHLLRKVRMPSGFLPTDTELVIRCPHCLLGVEFRPMIAYEDGRFVCRDCAHTVRPGVPEYRCTCRPCLRGARGDQTEIAALLLFPDC